MEWRFSGAALVAACCAAVCLAPSPSSAQAPSKSLNDCYGVCNRTVPDQTKRNACFRDCRSRPSAGSSSQPASKAAPRASSAPALSCEETCRGKPFLQRSACRTECARQEGLRHASDDRRQAQQSASQSGAALGAGNCKKGCEDAYQRAKRRMEGREGVHMDPQSVWVGNCVAACSPAMPACREALGILRGAKGIPAGRAGFLGEEQIRFWEQKLGTCEVADEGTRRTAEEIKRAWNKSLSAPRYGAELH